MKEIFAFFSFALGACIASFLNVVIWRVPRGESIVRPASHCPKCNARIKWWNNIPILSWLALRGKCADCKAPISPRYVIVETIGGLLFLAEYLRLDPLVGNGFGIWPPAAVFLLFAWIWISLMIVGSFIDFDLQLLPDFVTVGGMILGVIHAITKVGFICLYVDPLPHWTQLLSPLGFSLAGLALGFGLLYLIRFVGSKIFKREAMGLGDVFLMGAVGALFGPVAVVFTLIASSIAGSIAGLGMIACSKLKLGKFVAIPYGPYIAIGCIVWMLRGPEFVQAYLQLILGK